jgi:hypothetical protein
MTQQQLLNEFKSLPSEAQRQVADFIAFLRQKYRTTPPVTEKRRDLDGEGFIGMWAKREDMADSTNWVRQTREQEW